MYKRNERGDNREKDGKRKSARRRRRKGKEWKRE